MQENQDRIDDEHTDELAGHLNGIIRALLVAGRRGAPAEGRIPFNPLYFNILRVLKSDGPCRPSQVAEFLAVPRTTMSTAVKALTRKGLIIASKDQADGRAIALSLSDEGKEVLAAILRQDKRNSQAMLAALDSDEREAFVKAIGKIADKINRP